MERIERHASFGGWQDVYAHQSITLGCSMKFGVYIPPQAKSRKVPVLYWLSGLTCNEQNFINKSGVQAYAAEHGIAIITPDTSPRGEMIADDPAYDLGQGAGFYVNATQAPWAGHYNMYDYIVDELPQFIEENFPVTDVRSISGHSMGGHGALMIALKNPESYKSVSAFSPIVAPSQVPWGQKAFAAYLGDNEERWKEYDSQELARTTKTHMAFLVEQGLADDFVTTQLQPDLFRKACEEAGHKLTLNLREGYDHSYYFIASFIAEHIKYHAAALNGL